MKQGSIQPYTFDRTVRLIISALLVIAALYLLYVLRGVLLPFLIAWLVAYMLNPIVRFFQRRLKLAHSLAVVLTLLLVAVVLTALGFALVPLIQDEIHQITDLMYNGSIANIGSDKVSMTINEYLGKYVRLEDIRNSLSKETFVETIQYLSPAVEKIFSNTLSLLVGLTVIFLTMLYLVFILLDYDKINALWQLLIPPKYRPVVNKITLDVEHSMNRYFRHQAFICIILSILYAVGFQIIGLPLAIVFGIVVGLIHMIPYLQVVTFPAALLLCWLRASQTDDSFWMMLGLTILIYIIVQCIMDLFLVPKIMGKAMGLNPAIILLSLSIWGFLFGIVGMIIAIPLTTLLLSYYKEFISSKEAMLEFEAKLKEEEQKE